MKPLIIGITGGSGSGKTSFINLIRQSFSEDELCIVSQDDYYRPKEEQKTDKEGVINFDLPKSINKEEFLRDIQLLSTGKEIQRPEYTFNNSKATPKMLHFKPAPIIIVEGLFVFHFKKIRKLLDMKVFIQAKENLKVIRRIKRDQVERNYPLEDVLYRYENHVLPTYEKYILPYKDRADLIVNNNRHFKVGLKIMKGFIKQELEDRNE